MLTKGAIGNLVNRYKAVLKKCNLINTFGSLAVASMLVLGGAGVAGAESTTSRVVGTDLEYTDHTFENITNNDQRIYQGGGVHTSGTSIFTNCIFTNISLIESGTTNPDDHGDVHGGALYNDGGTVTITGGSFTNNRAESNDFYAGDDPKGNVYGAAIANNYGTMTINGVTFDNNTTKKTNNSDCYGSVIFNSGTMTIKNSTISNSSGGRAVFVSGTEDNPSTITLENNTFSNNARGCVQAEYKYCTVTFEGTENKFIDNQSVSIKNKGNVIFAEGSAATFTGNKYDIENVYDPSKNQLGSLKIKENSSVNLGTGNEKGGMIGNGTVELAGTLSGRITTEDASDTSADANSVNIRSTGIWKVTGDSKVNEFDLDEGSNVNIAQNVNVAAKSVGGIGNINMVDATSAFSAETAEEGTALTVQAIHEDGTVKTADEVTVDDLNAMAAKVTVAQGNATIEAYAPEGDIIGDTTVDQNGNETVARNSLMDAALQTSVTAISLDKILTNDVRKRLGDIRSDANKTGVWMRWDGGKLKGDAGVTNNFNTIQIGGDTKVAKNCRLGVAGSFTHGDTEFARGTGELEGFSFAAYATWMGDNGMFADVVARLGRFSTEMQVEGRTGDIDSNVASLSGEYGWRFNVCDQFFVEPQVELAYTYVSSDDMALGDSKYSFDSVDSLTGRVGLVAGWNLPDDRGNVYARASVVQQFMGDAKITGTKGTFHNVQELGGDDTWLEYGIGANVKLTDSTYIWADVERTEGAEIDEEWRGTVGVRFSF